MRAALVAALAACGFSSSALAQTATTAHSQIEAAAPGVAINGQISVVYDCGPGTGVGMLRSGYADSAFGADATSVRIFSGLDQAARAGLMQALANGARSGRADVVALAYEIAANGVAGNEAQQWAPIGMFVHVTEMSVDATGRAAFRSHVEFIPDSTRIELRSVDPPQ